MAKKSSPQRENPFTDSNSTSRKKGGIKARLQTFLEKWIAYIETMVLYAQKNLEVSIKKMIVSSVWLFSALFLVFFAIAYISYGVFLSFEKHITEGDPILSSFGTGGLFLLIAFVFVEIILKKK